MIRRLLGWLRLDWVGLSNGPFHHSYAKARSSLWPGVRKQFLQTHKYCAGCNTHDDLDVHHIKPYHLFPEEELDPENLLTLCRTCHFYFGHLKDWLSYNSKVRQDAAVFLVKVMSRPAPIDE